MYASNPDIAASALSPDTWPFSLELLPPQACLVGGAVRDALLGRRSEYLDLDFVLPVDAVETARKLANHYKAGFVVLDAGRQIARVVFKQATVDLAKQEGDSLESDLHRRDFTINAIAYNPHTGELIDPLQGIADIQTRTIRMVKAANLEDDPLRLLRGYRQAAQLNFAIEPETQAVMRRIAGLLGEIAAERVQVELGYLLKFAQGTPWLTAAWKDNLLQTWFPDATAQGLAQVAAIDQAAIVLEETWQTLGVELRTQGSGKSASLLSLAKLASLLKSLPKEAEEQLQRLKYSRAEIRVAVTTLKHLPRLLSYASSGMSIREQYFLFQDVGSIFPALAVTAVAAGMPVDALTPLINRYLNPDDRVAHPKALITGNDLMRSLNLPAGQQIGKLLGEIQLAQAEGKISTPEEALDFAAQQSV
jgi:tRNA nucleotidyltransferase (CCA-adding enzyme)